MRKGPVPKYTLRSLKPEHCLTVCILPFKSKLRKDFFFLVKSMVLQEARMGKASKNSSAKLVVTCIFKFQF